MRVSVSVWISCLNDHVSTSHTSIDFTKQDKKIAFRCIEQNTSSILVIVGKAHPNTDRWIYTQSPTRAHAHSYTNMHAMYQIRTHVIGSTNLFKETLALFSYILFSTFHMLNLPLFSSLLFVMISISIFAGWSSKLAKKNIFPPYNTLSVDIVM